VATEGGPWIADRYAVVDVDSHVIEPPDLWTERMPAKWGDLIPRVAYDEKYGEDRWWLGDRRLFGVGAYAAAGWKDFPPSHPSCLEDIHPAGYDAAARLRHLDENGIWSQMLYGNILGFQSHAFLRVGEAFATDCIRAYNEFLSDFCSADARRLVPLMMLPFWDVEASVAEMERAAAAGHKGIVFASEFEKIGYPHIADEHWDPILSSAQALGLPMAFHVGFAASAEDSRKMTVQTEALRFVVDSSLNMLGNARAIAEVVVSGLCDRYPRLDWVSIENGAGWLNFMAESLDWQWTNSRAARSYPERLLPSEYMQRQVYFTYWFEQMSMHSALERFEDNLMFETDFPHPTSLSPGPASASPTPREVIERSLGGLPETTVGKVLQHNAERLFSLEPGVRG
jgi:predicted TIM-barrel fold metal-dependent hydrolase